MAHDALVVGGGPSGCAAAIAIAHSGSSVALIDRGRGLAHPWAALLTHDARAELEKIGFSTTIHEIAQVRVGDGERSMVRSLPPGDLGVVRRPEFDDALLDTARANGVEVLDHHDAHRPVIERGFVRGADVVNDAAEITLRAEYTVIADGANSTFGRALGTHRRRDLPHLITARGTWSSPLSRVVECEVLIGLRRSSGEDLPGHATIIPDGDGSVTVTVVVPSTARDAAAVNPTNVLEETARNIADRWALDPDQPIGELRSARLPTGRSVGPVAGPTFCVVGDAAATADPLTALGLGPALVSGSLAGRCVAEAIATGASAPLQAYPDGLDEIIRRRNRWGSMALNLAGREVGNRALRATLRLAASARR